MDSSALVVGRTYFQLGFADPGMTMPDVEPLVFIGRIELEEGGDAFVFQDTVSYTRFGSRLELKADHDEITVYFLSLQDVDGLLDIHGISLAVAEAADRARSLDYPTLPVLRDGWTSVPAASPGRSLDR